MPTPNRIYLAYSQTATPVSPRSNRPSRKPNASQLNLFNSPLLAEKCDRLLTLHPSAGAVVESLIDRLLLHYSRTE